MVTSFNNRGFLFFYLDLFIFNGMIIAIQYCVGFCHISS